MQIANQINEIVKNMPENKQNIILALVRSMADNDYDETNYILSIPNMQEKIENASKEPISNGVKASEL